MPRPIRFLMLRSFLCWALLLSAPPTFVTAGEVSRNCYWSEISSPNFLIHIPRQHAAKISEPAKHCEFLRKQITEYWTDEAAPSTTWHTPCHIVVHATAESYARAVGAGGENTSGCATLKRLRGEVVSRRIDLRLDRPDPLNRVLPHELSHVLLADLCNAEELPRWVDEGFSLLADTDEKQQGHLRDLHGALRNRRVPRFESLLDSTNYPPPAEINAFYGQSLSLVQLLVNRKSPAEFLKFVEAGANAGYSRALADHYNIRDVAAFERTWQTAALRQVPASVKPVSLSTQHGVHR